MDKQRPVLALAPDDQHVLTMLALGEYPPLPCIEQTIRLRQDGLIEKGPTRYRATDKAVRLLFGVDGKDIAATLDGHAFPQCRRAA